MAKKDTTEKVFLVDNERYADIINGFVYHGVQHVRARDLQERDTQTGIWRFLHKNRIHLKNRDLLRRVALGVNYVVIGIENQETVDYLMPLRTMIYDVGEYEKQATKIRRWIRRHVKGLNGGEFLYSFRKIDKLEPVVTIILFYGDNWDGPRDLYGILNMHELPDEIKPYIHNYKMNLIEVKKIENTDVFKTDVKQVFDFIRYSKDKTKLKELVNSDPVFQNLEEDTYEVMASYTKADELIAVKEQYLKGGRVNMCEALTALLEDERVMGKEIERNKVNTLNKKLIADGRINDLARSTDDSKYQEKLFNEYGIE